MLNTFKDSNGNLSFTRVMGAFVITVSMVILFVSVVMRDGDIPSLDEGSTIVLLVGSAFAGKVTQKPFEKEKSNEEKS